MLASNVNNEVKHEAEVNNFAILEELKLFFMNKRRSSELQNCSWYNRVLEMYNAELVYDEEERIHKLWVNDESLEPQSAIQTLTAIIASLEALSVRNASGTPAVSNPMSAGSAAINACAAGDVITIIGDVTAGGPLYIGGNHKHKHYDKPLDEAALNAKETQALSQLKASYSTPEYTTIPGIFGPPLKLEGQYINLQILCTDLKTKKPEEGKESKESAEAKHAEKYKDARMASVEDLFGDKRVIKAENLFKPVRELFDNQALETVKNANEVPRLLLVQGRAGIGKTTFVRYAVHQWSKGQLYENYTWVFTLTLRKLRLLPNTPELSLSEWVRLSQFGDWEQKEFFELWQQRIELAIHQNKVLLILDGYDETPEQHPCQSALKNLLTSGGRYPNLALLMTTRPCSAGDISEKRRNLEIIGFTDENITQYIQSYFSKVPNKTLVDTLTETLRKQPVIWANAHIPLNLNLLCGIMAEAIQKARSTDLSQGLAELSSMTRLYEVMEKKLYERSYAKHDAVSLNIGKQLMRAQANFTKHYEKQRLFLAKLAFQSFEAERIIIPLQAIGVALQAYIDKEIPQNNLQQKEVLGEEFFKKVCELGLIKPVLDTSDLSQTQQDYEFLHLTFHEYYTAIYLVEAFSSKEPTTQAFAEKIISREKYNPRWQIVWWFVAGLLRENALIYQVYLQQLQGQHESQKDILEHYQLGLLVRCVDEGFELHNKQVIELVIQQLQISFLKYYQIVKNFVYVENLLLTNFPFFSACRISPNLCMNEKQDLYALIQVPREAEEKKVLLAYIHVVRIITPKAILTLVQLLTDEESNIRRFAAYVIGHLGAAVATPQICEALMRLSSDEDKDVRRSAAEAMGKLSTVIAIPQILDALEKFLADKDEAVSGFAAEALDRLGIAVIRPQMLQRLAALLVCGHWAIYSSAAKAARRLLVAGATTPQFFDALVKLLSDENENTRCDAAREVYHLGAPAATPQILGALAKLLADKDQSVRCSAAEAVGELGASATTPQFLDALVKLLSDEDKDTRRSAAEAVRRLGVAAAKPQMFDALTKLLVDEDQGVRRSAAEAVGNLGVAAARPQMLDALTKLLADEDQGVRRSAAEAVGNLGAATIARPQTLDALTKLLADEDQGVRRSAAEAVGNLGAATIARPQTLDALTKLLADEDQGVRRSAAEAVSNLGVAAARPQTLDALTKLLADEDKDVRRSAGRAVGRLGAPAATPQILDALAKLLTDKDDWVCRSATEAVGKLGRAAATPRFLGALSKLLTDKNSQVRCSAGLAVGKLGPAAATPELLNALTKFMVDEENSVVATYAAEAVGDLGAAAVRPQVLDALAKLLADEDWDVLQSAAKVVGCLDAAAATPEFLGALAKLFASKDHNVRGYAAEVAGRLGVAIFRLLPSFWLENANNPTIFNFVSNSLAVAYLNGQISCQIGFDADARPSGYYMRGFIEKSSYRFFITEAQARCLRRLSLFIIEQLSKAGSLNITDLRARLPEWEVVIQSLLLHKRQLAGGDRNVTIQPTNLENAEQKRNSPLLTQYEGSSRRVSEANQNHEGTKCICRIS